MFSWVPFAMVRIALFLTGGILLAIYKPGLISEQVTFYILFTLICVYLISVVTMRWWRWTKIFNGLLGLSTVFFFGYLPVQNYFFSCRRKILLCLPPHCLIQVRNGKCGKFKIFRKSRKFRQGNANRLLLYMKFLPRRRYNFSQPFYILDSILLDEAGG